MAVGLLRAGANVMGHSIQVASAGTIAGGQPAEPHAVEVMADRGIDISSHRSHKLAAVDIDAADLVLCMAREHVVTAAGEVFDAFDRIFTIKDFVARARAVGPKPADQPLQKWLAELCAGRSHSDLLRPDPELDVADPLGSGRRAYERTATELEGLSWAVLDFLAGYPPRG